ncbi:DUF4426 domain-containing protein [Oleiagrimonas sp.]|jgi:hypothetical protein|uniref:DUF4426 domain-containing protein n=1 Tax=Oleiagrimonas sp. TaxID=2010330 RepID=UPI002636C3BE|nr:DUF4426 domain-containing protein [Oleiagrimonas sp.]MDA3914354.1 DUF4426 domain-containing protein [Oleiagrimonas sp.]
MNPMFRRFAWTAALALLVPATALAQGVLHKGDLTIRYNALPATALPAQSASALGVKHSAGQGLLNVMVSTSEGDNAPGVEADVSARALAENGTAIPVHMREIKEANGISYLGTFRIRHTGSLRFDLDVTAPGQATQHIHFKHTFVID